MRLFLTFPPSLPLSLLLFSFLSLTSDVRENGVENKQLSLFSLPPPKSQPYLVALSFASCWKVSVCSFSTWHVPVKVLFSLEVFSFWLAYGGIQPQDVVSLGDRGHLLHVLRICGGQSSAPAHPDSVLSCGQERVQACCLLGSISNHRRMFSVSSASGVILHL